MKTVKDIFDNIRKNTKKYKGYTSRQQAEGLLCSEVEKLSATPGHTGLIPGPGTKNSSWRAAKSLRLRG